MSAAAEAARAALAAWGKEAVAISRPDGHTLPANVPSCYAESELVSRGSDHASNSGSSIDLDPNSVFAYRGKHREPRMTVRLPADTMPGLDVVTDADREWFEARPSRRCRLRPTTVAELFPGEVMRPGSRTVVVTLGSPLVRMRFRVGRPPVGLRQDTDRSCVGLLLLLARAGYTIEGRPLLSTLRDLRQQVGTVLASQP